jgi:hypothetical protein
MKHGLAVAGWRVVAGWRPCGQESERVTVHRWSQVLHNP